MAVALSGAVIVHDDGRMLSYRKKCESCGNVDSGTVRTTPPSNGNISSSSYFCSKCRQQNQVRIQG